MKTRHGLLLLVGLVLLHFALPATAMVEVVGFKCYSSGSSSVDGGPPLTTQGFCDPIYGSFGGGSFGDGDHIFDGGGGHFTVPNRGDVSTSQRNANAGTGTGCDDPAKSVSAAGNPVIFSTGNKVESEVDFVSGGSMPLSLKRTYNYYWNGIGIFGRRWLSDYDYKLLFTTDDPTSPCYTRPGNTRCDPLNKPICDLAPEFRTLD